MEDSEFYQTKILPRIEKFAGKSKELKDMLVSVINPRGMVDPKALSIIYKLKGGRDELNWLLEQQLKHWGDLYYTMDRKAWIESVDRAKRGMPQVGRTPEEAKALQAANDFMASVEDEKWDALNDIGALNAYVENHRRVMWKEPPSFGRKAPEGQRGFLGVGKRPLRGTRGYLKRQFHIDMTEGLTWTFSRDSDRIIQLEKRSRAMGENAANPKIPEGFRKKSLEKKAAVDAQLAKMKPFNSRDTVMNALKWVPANEYKVVDLPHGGVDVVPYSDKAIEALKRVKGPDFMPEITEKRGGTPTYWNPMTMFQADYADTMKYLTIRKAWDDAGKMGLRKFVRQGGTPPDGFIRVDDSMVKSYFKAPTSKLLSDAKDLVKKGEADSHAEAINQLSEDAMNEGKDVRISDLMAPAGEWWVEKGFGTLLNRMVSKDAIRGNMILRGLIGIKNGWTAVELGLSPFHLGFEANETVSSMLGLGMRELFLSGTTAAFDRTKSVPERMGLAGRLAIQGAKDIATAPISWVPGLRRIPGVHENVGMERLGADAKRFYAETGAPYVKARGLQERIDDLDSRIKRMKDANPKKQELKDKRDGLEADRLAAQGEYDKAVNEYQQTRAGAAFLKRFPNASELVHDYFMGGGKLHMDESYRIRAGRSLVEAYKEAKRNGETFTRGLTALPAFNEALLRPLFDVYIPNLKVATFIRDYSLAKIENEGALRRGEITTEQLARKTVDFVEDRYGEMNFDNLFWHNTFKTAAQLITRSITWKYGSLRAYKKAGVGAYKTFRDFVPAIRRGEAPSLDPAAAWMVGLLTWTTAQSVAMSALLGHQSPTETFKKIFHGDLTEIVYPHIDATGSRASIATYLRDLIHAKRNPLGYLTSSMSGDIGRIIEAFENKDFYGTEIYHPADPAWKKGVDLGRHLIPTPFSIQSGWRAHEEGRSVQAQALGAMGYTKAPSYIEQSPAEQTAHEYALQQLPRAARTSQEAEHSRLKSQLATQMHRGVDISLTVAQRIQEGKLTPRDVTDIERWAAENPLSRAMARITDPDQLLDIWEKASPDEQQEIGDDVLKRLDSEARRNPGRFDARLMDRLRKLGFIQDEQTAEPPLPRTGTGAY